MVEESQEIESHERFFFSFGRKVISVRLAFPVSLHISLFFLGDEIFFVGLLHKEQN